MSATDDGPGTREVARRLFATEYEDASLSYSESDEERAPNYVITPTGARINRMFVVGVFTETERVNEEMLRARIVDPTGAFVSYAGQYQPDALSFFERATPPEFVAVTGKARTFQPEDSDRVFTSVRPESVNAVDAETRDRWVVSAVESTLRRVAAYDAALDTGLRGDDLAEHLRERDVDESLATGIPLAIDHYGTTRDYLEAVRRVAVDALEVVAGEREEVRPLDIAPDEGGETDVGPIPEGYGIEGGEAIAESSVDATESEPPAESESAGESEAPDSAPTDPEPAIDTTGAADGAEGGASEDEAPAEADATEATPSELDGEAEELGGGSEELGDFGTETGAEQDETAGAEEGGEAALDEEGMYELDEEERREVEEEFGVEFSSGAEVGEPGEAGIEAEPDGVEAETTETEPATLDEAAEEVAAEAEETVTETEQEEAETTTDTAETATDTAETATDAGEAEVESSGESADVDLESVAVEKMDELDEGDGAQRDRVIAAVVEEYGADPGAVDDAIQDALMDGRCYEPGDDRLKAI